jgi:16S rRNA (adenine(1408)-N(1))-methyltransferase
VGTGDGRFVYRLARAHLEALFTGIDANAQVMRDASFRASRKPARGGVPNALHVRASLDELPGALGGLADVVTVPYPWGSLLEAVLAGERALVTLARPDARFDAVVN